MYGFWKEVGDIFSYYRGVTSEEWILVKVYKSEFLSSAISV